MSVDSPLRGWGFRILALVVVVSFLRAALFVLLGLKTPALQGHVAIALALASVMAATLSVLLVRLWRQVQRLEEEVAALRKRQPSE